MKSLSPIKLNLVEKFKEQRYFQRFFRGRSQDEIVAAIQELRDMRGNLTQGQLADRCGMKTSAVCRLEKPEYGRWNFQTLWRIAEALDARWRFILEPRESVIEAYVRRDFSFDAAPILVASSIVNAKLATDKQDSSGKSVIEEQKDRGIVSLVNASVSIGIDSGGQKAGMLV
jgi:transcriptional regulator with XRE-family HTH domain